MLSSDTDACRLTDYDFDLPDSLIAQEPAPVRDRSRLMVLDRKIDRVDHEIFSQIGNYFRPGDLLVLNNTRVFPCRLTARKPGGGKAEIFLLSEKALNVWNALVKGGLSPRKKVTLDSGIDVEIVANREDGTKDVKFQGVKDIKNILAEIGKTPLPPYIKREATAEDAERYQTVFAEHDGAVAAPTAGLHFTRDLLHRLKEQGILSTTITLHVGPGTFQPVRTELITEHRMHPEQYEISQEAASVINKVRQDGGRVIAVGTTSVRTMETAASEDGTMAAGKGDSRLFIYPGYRFKVADALVTNFHLPKSTLLMLVSAFAGREKMLEAYRVAVANHYRFYSFGDAMLIV